MDNLNPKTGPYHVHISSDQNGLTYYIDTGKKVIQYTYPEFPPGRFRICPPKLGAALDFLYLLGFTTIGEF